MNVARERVAWGLAAIVFATTLSGTIQLARTGAFEPWLLQWSMGVYAVATIVALALVVGAREKVPAKAAVEIVYETNTGRLERQGRDGGATYSAVFDDGRHSEADVRRRVDALPMAAAEPQFEQSADAAIAKRAVKKKGGVRN